jgi:CRISPR system Cascade subunit CasD
MAANTLFLRLEGPLQSWGERARWSVRDTAPEPTKSGIVGLLGCALGINDDAGLRELSEHLRMGVRCDRPGTPLVDYHTVGGGHDEPALLTAEGKLKYSSGGPHTEQTWRHYLCDAAFLVALQGPSNLIARLAEAIQAPRWPIYLGRKSCVPTRPPFDGTDEFADLESALRAQDLSGFEKPERSVSQTIRAVIECAPENDGATRRRDELTSRTLRTFAPRYTRDVWLTFTQTGGDPCTYPD